MHCAGQWVKYIEYSVLGSGQVRCIGYKVKGRRSWMQCEAYNVKILGTTY